MRIKRTIAVLFTALSLGVMWGSLFHVSMGMDMAGSQTSCPLMVGQETICSMNALEHLSAWQSHFLAIATPAVLSLGTLVTLVISGDRQSFPRQARSLTRLTPTVLLQDLDKKLLTFCRRPLQEFFARGILHPKLFS